ncbi:MAG: hypothetical protein RIC55_01840 [Pirellulaceae bacterium]
MRTSHCALALGLLIVCGMATESFAGGFVITPLGGFVRGPQGFFAFSPLGIAGRRNPVCMPAGGYSAMSYGYAQPMPLMLAGPGSNAASEAQGVADTIQLIQAIMQLTRGGLGIGGGGGASNLEPRVQALEADVAALKMLMNLSANNANSGAKPGAGKPGMFDPATVSMAQALQRMQQAQAGAQADAGLAQESMIAAPSLSPDQVNLLAKQMLLQMKMRKLAVEAEGQQIKDDAAQLEAIFDKLKAEAAALK